MKLLLAGKIGEVLLGIPQGIAPSSVCVWVVAGVDALLLWVEGIIGRNHRVRPHSRVTTLEGTEEERVALALEDRRGLRHRHPGPEKAGRSITARRIGYRALFGGRRDDSRRVRGAGGRSFAS